MYQDTSKDERYQIDSFISDDKKHFVEWKFSKELGYPTWICKHTTSHIIEIA